MDPQELERAKSAQSRLLNRIETIDGVQGLGIGMSAMRDRCLLQVLVETRETIVRLPEEVDGVPVVGKVVGTVRAI